jgi:hypothetical protein
MHNPFVPPARRRLFAAAFAMIAAAPAAALRPCDAPAPLGPSRDLYCLELVPAPGIEGVTARVELGHPPGPFTVAVAADGRMRQRLTIVAEGLPEPGSLGEY